MSERPTLTDLTANLVPFTAHQVKTSLIWSTADEGDGEVLRDACSYLVDSDDTCVAKVFLAERYGGSGIQRNGGGARCGFDGRYQIKGIGANPLVGQGSDWHHSNGALGAGQAIYEALWGDILAQILPYGAVATRAILLTDNYIDIEFERSRGRSRRALLIREPVIRPAHFERAPYFRPQSAYAGQLMHDAQRVRAVIGHLPACLPTPSDGFSTEARCDPRTWCIEGLCELARRQAQQMAYCQTRFLMLTTSPSNIAMDGRVLDFNGLNCLFPSDHRDDFEYRLKTAQLIGEPAILQQGLSDLCLYLGKYMFEPTFTQLARQQVTACFQRDFQQACYHGYATLLGIPAELLQRGGPASLERLVDSFMRLLNSRRGTLCHADNGESPLERLVVTLIHRSWGLPVHDDACMAMDVRFAHTQELFNEVMHWANTTCRVEQRNSFAFMSEVETQARERLKPRRCLGKVQMLREIDELLETCKDDERQLRLALAEMKTRVLAFATVALGCQQTIGHGAENRGNV